MHSQSQMVHWHNFQVHWDQNGSTACRSRPPGHVIFCSLGIQWKKIELSIDLSAVVISRRPAVGAPAALVIATRVKIQNWLCPLRIDTMVYQEVYHQLMAILVWKMMINHNMYGMVFPFSQTQIFAAHGLGLSIQQLPGDNRRGSNWPSTHLLCVWEKMEVIGYGNHQS